MASETWPERPLDEAGRRIYRAAANKGCPLCEGAGIVRYYVLRVMRNGARDSVAQWEPCPKCFSSEERYDRNNA